VNANLLPGVCLKFPRGNFRHTPGRLPPDVAAGIGAVPDEPPRPPAARAGPCGEVAEQPG